MKVVITGGCGKAGRYIIPEFLNHGYEAVNVDIAHHPDSMGEFRTADLMEYDQTLAAFEDADAIIHMARSDSRRNPEAVFAVNVTTTWNVLQAAEELEIKKCVLASSVNAIGAVFSHALVPPEYFPIDEKHPTRAEDAYSQSKWVGEQIADGFARRSSVQIASFRFHALLSGEDLASYRNSPNDDPRENAKDFWGYLHLADCGRACRLALEHDWTGHEAFFINAADTSLTVTTLDALHAVYPGVPLVEELFGYTSPLSIKKAKDLFSWEPQITWRQ